MKKFVYFFTLFVLILSSNVFAKELTIGDSPQNVIIKDYMQELYEINSNTNLTKNSTTYTITEFDLLENLKSKTDVELKEQGFSQNQIDDLRKANFEKEVLNLQKLSNDELLIKGFSQNQIDDIKNYDKNNKLKSKTTLRNLSGKLTLTYTLLDYYYSSSNNRTYCRIRLKWRWNTNPLFTFHDMVAQLISENMYMNPSTSYHRVYYYKSNESHFFKNIKYNMETDGNTTSFMRSKFDMNTFYPGGPDPGNIAKLGFAYFGWSKYGKINEISTVTKYGHSYANVFIDTNVSATDLSFTITPTISVDEIGTYNYHLLD